MLVTSLRLKNWRNFRSVHVPIRARTFLIGPNAAGKSNFLDVFRFLRDVAKQGGGGLQKAMSDRGGLSKVRCLSARQDPVVEIEVEISDGEDSWRYGIGVNQQNRGPRQTILHWERVYKNEVLLLSRPDAADKADPQRLTQTHLEQISLNAEFRELVRFLESITYLHLIPQLVRNPDAFPSPMGGDPFGRDFLERLARSPEKTRERRLKWIEKELGRIVPQLKELRFVRDEVGVPHLEATYEHWRPNAGRQREDQFSDGTLRLIALFWLMLETDSLLLLEEPELSLNASVVEQLPHIIYGLQTRRKRQVLLSSHSPEMLRDEGIEPESVLVFAPDPNGTLVEPASSFPDVVRLLDSGIPLSETILKRTVPGRLQPVRYVQIPS